MPTRSITTFTTSVVLAGAILAMTMPLGAQRRRGADNASQGTPVATNTILRHPDAYYGKSVTVTAGIEQVLSKTAFVVDQRKTVTANGTTALGQPLLVIAPSLNGALDSTHYVLVRGQIVKFDPAEIARLAPGYAIDLVTGVGERFVGKPVLVATSVIDSTYKDLVKRPIAPSSTPDGTRSAQP